LIGSKITRIIFKKDQIFEKKNSFNGEAPERISGF
jgi:hypothetical protein